MTTIRESLKQTTDSDLIFMEPPVYDQCILGLAQRCGMAPVVVYDRTLVLMQLVRDGRAWGEAMEFIELNMLGSYAGPRTPLIMDRLTAAPQELQGQPLQPLRLSEAITELSLPLTN